MNEQERQVDQEPQPNEQIAGDRLLKTLGIDPKKWTVGDRRIALLGIGIGLTIVIIAVCGYAFGWPWTGLTEPKPRTFWDWLSLLIVPIVLALGGYLFTRSESRRTKEDAEQRAQDDALQAYLDHIGRLLLDKDRPLRQSIEGDEVRTLVRAWTLTVLRRLDSERKGRVLQFLYEAGLIAKDHLVLDLMGADLSEANLSRANLGNACLGGTNLKGANLIGVYLRGADLSGADLSEAKLWVAVLRGADLNKADLRRADLSEAKMWGADLKDAKLNAAKLRAVNLWYAKLNRANLSEAYLGRADLSGADLSGVLGVTNEELQQQAASLKGATMSNGQKYEDWLKSRGEGG